MTLASFFRIGSAEAGAGFMKTYLKWFTVDDIRGFFLCFLLGFTVRLVPEVLSYPYPIGFDTITYAVKIKNGVVWAHWGSVFESTWLFCALLMPVYMVTQVDPFFILKLVAPLLYALNVGGIYYFARRGLSWGVKKALFAAFFFAFQLSSLRVSWDLYKNTLGMAILLFALPWIRGLDTKSGFIYFVLLSMFVLFSHEVPLIILFVAVAGTSIKAFLNVDKAKLLKILAAMSPVSAIFLMRIIDASTPFTLFPIQHNETNVISAVPGYVRYGGLFLRIFRLTDYLNVGSKFDPVYYYPTYLSLASQILCLFAVLYLVWLPLVFVGSFRDKILDGWTLFLLVGSFNALITPFCALDFWNRWMFMLVYPFTFYATNGFWKIRALQANGIKLSLKRIKMLRKMAIGTLSCTVLFGSLFMVMPVNFAFFSSGNTNANFPSTMLHNTVPLEDVESVLVAISWLNENMTNGSCVLLHQAFLSWAELYLEKKRLIVYYTRDAEMALNVALEHNLNPIYLIWWNRNIGWYGLTVPQNFAAISNSGRISVFKYFSL